LARVTGLLSALIALMVLAGTVSAQIVLISIQDATSPETTLTASQISGNAPMTVIFTALCKDDIEIASCIISFGDGANQILQRIQLPQTITHTYSVTGNFVVTLTATDRFGNSDQTPALITINVVRPNIEPQTFLQAFPTTGESPSEVTFIATCKDDDGLISSCEIDFGDGAKQALTNAETPQTVLHTYENERERIIFRPAILSARDDSGAGDQTPAGIMIQVLPGFSDKPETFINAFPVRGKSPLLVNFDVLCFSANFDISSCVIEFGDGEQQNLLNIETPQQISHVYVNPEVSDLRRIAKVRASDERGRIDATPAEVTIVVESDIGNAPTTDLQATPTNGPAPLQVTFAARCRDLQRRLVSCVLDFGDGQTQFLPTVESVQTLTHIYQRDGRYIAALNARDAEGLTDLTPSSVTITVGSLDIVDEDGKAPGEKKRLLEFGIDIANFKEEDSFVSAKRLFNGLLFGSNEIRLDVPKSFVKEVVIEVKETNRLGELVVTLDDQELFRGKPEPVPDNAALKTANLAARYEKGKLIIPVNEDNEGLLKIKVTSSGFIFWAPAVYEIKASVIADVEKVTQDRFDFTLDNELQGFKSARITVLPRGAAVILNDNKIIGEAIPKEYFRQLNTIEFSAAPDTTVSGKVGIEIVYEDV